MQRDVCRLIAAVKVQSGKVGTWRKLEINLLFEFGSQGVWKCVEEALPCCFKVLEHLRIPGVVANFLIYKISREQVEIALLPSIHPLALVGEEVRKLSVLKYERKLNMTIKGTGRAPLLSRLRLTADSRSHGQHGA